MTEFLEAMPMETLPAQQSPNDLLAQGAPLMQTKTQFHTAVQVQKPRDLDRIVANIMKEADYAGSDFYYSWPVKDRRTGKQTIVEGPSIGAAISILREWGNCVLDVQVDEHEGVLVFTPRVIDLENGTTITRIFRFRPTAAPGKYDADRWEDMQFQVAQSKAIRNVVVAAVPRWLCTQAVERAKRAALDYLDKVGASEAKQRAVEFFEGYGIDQAQLEKHLGGVAKKAWTGEHVAQLRSLAGRIRDGELDVNEIFEGPTEDELWEQLFTVLNSPAEGYDAVRDCVRIAAEENGKSQMETVRLLIDDPTLFEQLMTAQGKADAPKAKAKSKKAPAKAKAKGPQTASLDDLNKLRARMDSLKMPEPTPKMVWALSTMDALDGKNLTQATYNRVMAGLNQTPPDFSLIEQAMEGAGG